MPYTVRELVQLVGGETLESYNESHRVALAVNDLECAMKMCRSLELPAKHLMDLLLEASLARMDFMEHHLEASDDYADTRATIRHDVQCLVVLMDANIPPKSKATMEPMR